MTEHGSALPHTSGRTVLTDSGLETDLIFSGGFDLPDFASYPLLGDERGRAALRADFDEHARIAADAGLPVVLETPTWRASSDWGTRLGHDAAALDRLNREAVALLRSVREQSGAEVTVSGNLGPRGDGYVAGTAMTVDEAAAYHRPQVESLAAAGADVITVLTATYAAEATGVVRAAQAAGMPVVVSVTVETDGRLPDGSALGDAVRRVDDETDAAAACFLLNCAHPDHVAHAVETGAEWWSRVRGLRANASRMSHAELDEAEELDDGDPVELAEQLVALRDTAGLTVLGGCCGTDARHVRALAARVTGTVSMPRQAESAASTSSRGIPSRNSTASR